MTSAANDDAKAKNHDDADAAPVDAAAANPDELAADADEVAEGTPSPDDDEAVVAADGAKGEATGDDDDADGEGASLASGGTQGDAKGDRAAANDAEDGGAPEDPSAKDDGTDEGAGKGDEEGAAPSETTDGEGGVGDDSCPAAEVEAGGATDDDDEGEEEEEEEELWDLKVVLPVDQILASATMCDTPGCNLVACCIWSSNRDPETPWYSCLDCQENDFGGWPEKNADLPIKTWKGGLREAMLDKCTALVDPPMPDLPSDAPPAAPPVASSAEGSTTEEDKSSDDADDDSAKEGDASSSGNEAGDGDGEEGGEMWELKRIFGVQDLKKKKPTMCSYGDEGGCDLVACSQWVCVSGHDPNPWFCCLDHQKTDYGGWPEEESEFPVGFLTEENRELILEKCANEEAEMPGLPTTQLLVTAGDPDKGDGVVNNAITPPPSHGEAVVEDQSEVVVGMTRARGGKSKKRKGGVTPSPVPPKGAAAAKPAAKKKPSAAQTQKSIEMRNKWQAEAERMGGRGARIVVSKPEAKKVIFDMLHDSFAPMNTNGTFQKLKGVVPPPILRACLDEMVDKQLSDNPFADSDDDEDGKSSKKGGKKPGVGADEYAGALRLKEGRNINNNLFYVDHTKLANNGDGLLPDARNELLSDMQGSKAEHERLSAMLKNIAAQAARLESEPKNEELMLEVVELENKMEAMNKSLEEARVHASNEKRAKAIKKGIEGMGSIWRKRKRQCIEFVSNMEDATEGTISLKKCLKGDGPIDIDSDEAAIIGAMAFAKRKRPRVTLVAKRGLAGARKGNDASSGVRPDPNFIGVRLTAQGRSERVYAEDEV